MSGTQRHSNIVLSNHKEEYCKDLSKLFVRIFSRAKTSMTLLYEELIKLFEYNFKFQIQVCFVKDRKDRFPFKNKFWVFKPRSKTHKWCKCQQKMDALHQNVKEQRSSNDKFLHIQIRGIRRKFHLKTNTRQIFWWIEVVDDKRAVEILENVWLENCVMVNSVNIGEVLRLGKVGKVRIYQ